MSMPSFWHFPQSKLKKSKRNTVPSYVILFVPKIPSYYHSSFQHFTHSEEMWKMTKIIVCKFYNVQNISEKYCKLPTLILKNGFLELTPTRKMSVELNGKLKILIQETYFQRK
jgi:hypothetical protein